MKSWASERRDKHSRQSKASSREQTRCAAEGEDSMGEAKPTRSRQADKQVKEEVGRWTDFGLYSK